MEIRFMERGTALTLLESTLEQEILGKYTAEYDNNETNTLFLVDSDDLLNHLDHIGEENHFKISFFRKGRLYEFNGRLRGVVKKNNQRYIQLEQISPVKEGTRRSTPRHEILTTVTVYTSKNSHKIGEWLTQGQTLDISLEGLCLLTNTEMPPPDTGVYYHLEFTIGRGERFLLPARLVRVGSSPQTVQYHFDYGFVFDLNHRQEERDRLLTALFNSCLRSRK